MPNGRFLKTEFPPNKVKANVNLAPTVLLLLNRKVETAVVLVETEVVLAETASKIGATETAAETLVTEMRIMSTDLERAATHNPVAITDSYNR